MSGGYYEAGGKCRCSPQHDRKHHLAIASAPALSCSRPQLVRRHVLEAAALIHVSARPGSFLKLGVVEAFLVTMLGWSVDSFPAGFTKSGDLADALNATKWGADYLVRPLHGTQSGARI